MNLSEESQEEERTRTGIPALDEMLGGGLMTSDATLVAGSAGTGKTTLGLEFLYNGATKFDENGIFLTFEQLPQKIYRDAKHFGWDLRELERQGRIKIICTSPDLLVKGEAGAVLDGPIREMSPKRVVIDSMSNLEMCIARKDVRKESYGLLSYLRMKGMTSIVTGEMQLTMGNGVAPYVQAEVGMSFLVDTVILLRNVEIESSIRKALVVLKMRGSNHEKQLREYEITSEGIRIMSAFEKFDGLMTGTPRRRLERQLVQAQESERRLFQFLEALPVGVFIINKEGKPYYANEISKRILGKGIAPGAGIDQLSEVYQAYHSETGKLYPADRLPIVRALGGETVTIDDMEIRAPDKTRQVQVWAGPVFDTNGKVEYAIAAFVDIGDRGQLERAKEKITSAIGNELSTPKISQFHSQGSQRNSTSKRGLR